MPRSGMIRQECSFSPASFRRRSRRRRAVQLADDDALGAVDDELAAADHDRHVAEVDLFFDRLFLVQAQPDAERPAIGQAQLAALVRAVARLAELVLDVFQAELLVVALDREDFAQHAFQAGGVRLSAARPTAGSGRRTGLQSVRGGHFDGVAEAAEVAPSGGDDALCRDGHSSCSPKRKAQPGRPKAGTANDQAATRQASYNDQW